MEAYQVLKIGCSRFIFGENTIQLLPDEIVRYGKKALIVGGATTLPLVMDQMREAIVGKRVTIIEQVMDQPNSIQFAHELAALAQAQSIQVLVAIGGGKCMDLCKVCADFASLPLVTVPTSIATCAACSAVSIMYTSDNGSYDRSVPKEREVESVVVDISIIRNAPPRLTASGILDSLAKFPEIVNGPKKLTYPQKSLQGYMAYCNAVVTYDILTRFGAQVYHNPQSELMQDIALINLIVTSMISGFSSGSDQLAIAHGLYDGVRKFFPLESAKSLHGEIVAVGLLIQLRFNRTSDAEYQSIYNLMKEMHMPLTLQSLGIEPLPENLKRLRDYNIEKNAMANPEDIERLDQSFLEIV